MINNIIEATIIHNEKIASEVFRLILQCGDSAIEAQPGQFINVYLQDKSMLLPRPISICLAEKGQITLVYKIVGKGTKELAGYKAGANIRISTPLGHGYDVDVVFKTLNGAASNRSLEVSDGENQLSGKTIALVAGGLGVPPMVELAKTLRKMLSDNSVNKKENETSNRDINKRVKLIAVIGFQEEVFLAEELKGYCDGIFIATEKGIVGYQGNVIEMMEEQQIKADYYFACGPKPMLKAIASLCNRLDKPLQVSLEERMGCGYGACVGCTCKTQELEDGRIQVKQKKVCKDGPVFFGNEVVWDE